MGLGKRQVCCCDSIIWCDFIKWAYIICGMVFLLSIALVVYRREEAKDAASKISSGYYPRSYGGAGGGGYSPSGSGGGSASGNPFDKAEAEEEKQFYYAITKSGISGLFCIVMGALVWFGASSRSSMCLMCYIIIQLVLCVFSIVSLLGGIIVYENSTGVAQLTAFPAVFMTVLFVWVVDIQRKEFALENPQIPMYEQQLQPPQEMQQWQPQGPGPYPEQSQEQEQSDSETPSQKQHHKKHHHSKKEPLEASSSNAV